ncbi:hypothetical protein [Pseudoalteromonas sp. S16_S37]|uniref:hypothetical protein n=1 Tax=Pseudoalteromonas sp. S16_S37 TaxID=2720228 RepID=UPI001680CCDA|nr:hypothetical protein [Pseudoalteromonas sp. S16_S37]MBD1584683.1 hypothetical protein [Pseudoalteromonas sp. S16_S37]
MENILPTTYMLEIYAPDDDRAVVAHFQSTSPFMHLAVGDMICPASLNMAAVRDRLEVAGVEHIFWEIEAKHQVQKVCVRTKAVSV